MSKRGVVVSARFEVTSGSCTIKSSALEPEDLREYLLYWDRIDWPDNNLISLGSTPEVDFLIGESILTRTRVNFGSFSGNVSVAFLTSQAVAFQNHTKLEPGSWTVAQCSNALLLPLEGVKQEQSIEVDLYRALPVPRKDVSLQDILEFKQRRSSELAALRAALDELYLEIINSADIPRAKIAALESLESRLSDLRRVFDETWTTRLLSSMKVQLNIPDLAAKTLGAAMLASSFGLSVPAAAAVAAVASAIKFEAKPSSRLSDLPKEVRQLAYVKYAQEEI